jgi:hypothetical protein
MWLRRDDVVQPQAVPIIPVEDVQVRPASDDPRVFGQGLAVGECDSVLARVMQGVATEFADDEAVPLGAVPAGQRHLVVTDEQGPGAAGETVTPRGGVVVPDATIRIRPSGSGWAVACASGIAAIRTTRTPSGECTVIRALAGRAARASGKVAQPGCVVTDVNASRSDGAAHRATASPPGPTDTDTRTSLSSAAASRPCRCDRSVKRSSWILRCPVMQIFGSSGVTAGYRDTPWSRYGSLSDRQSGVSLR